VNELPASRTSLFFKSNAELALSFLAGVEKDVEITENVLLLLAAALSPSPAAAQRAAEPPEQTVSISAGEVVRLQ